MAKRVRCPLSVRSRIFRNGRSRCARTRCQDKVADMAKRVSCPLPLVSRIFRNAATGAPEQDARIRWRTWPSASGVPCRWCPGSSGTATTGVPGLDTRDWPIVAVNMATGFSCPLSVRSRIFRNGRSRCARTRCRDKVADMTKRVRCPLSVRSRIFRNGRSRCARARY